MVTRRILVVEDEEHIVELIKYNLESNGYEVLTAFDGIDAIKIAFAEIPDLILLDLMLPQIDGIEVTKRLRKDSSTRDIPIIMLTAKSEEIDKIVGLEIGADDYITKPFSIRELMARIKAVLRRSKANNRDEIDLIKLGEVTIDIEKHEVVKKGNKIELTLKEFELLRILAENRGKVLSRNFLLDKVWGYDYFGETRTLDVHIRHLRKKIEDNNKNFRFIETVRGIGYKIK